jgi:hypothetical protein
VIGVRIVIFIHGVSQKLIDPQLLSQTWGLPYEIYGSAMCIFDILPIAHNYLNF